MLDLIELIKQNQFLVGGGAVAAFGFCANYIRAIPSKARDFAYNKLFISVRVDNGTLLFDYLSKYIYENKVTPRHGLGRTKYNDESKLEASIDPYHGFKKIFWFQNHPIWVKKVIAKQNSGGGDSGMMEQWAKLLDENHYIIEFLSWDAQIHLKFLEHLIKQYHVTTKNDKFIGISHHDSDGYWFADKSILQRRKETVISDVPAAMLEDINFFIQQKDWYKSLGIPYHRGYILYGPPGNGKTSIIHAVASEIGYSLYFLDLGSIKNDETLLDLIGDMPKRSILVLEDVDGFFNMREKKEEKKDIKITFSGLINALDGLRAPSGTIVILTTNYIDKLDPAMIRPGRIDRSFEIGNASALQAKALFLKFYGNEELAEQFCSLIEDGKYSMCDLQGRFINHKDNPEDVIKEFIFGDK